ncbi:ParB/RepB/Spo0J family partition protein [Enterococcus timonensis]|uniref:ParB/RepB/Spo0J family partition protein n=1 Tax=Enterococcus timonensis TaxID=1852364 RepID=UPI0008DA805D|nr:ParB/RepB/Spo0J family partition protein [Enterococcus timonensis]
MTKNKALGRGMDALFGDMKKFEDVDIAKEEVLDLDLNSLRPNPYQPRKTFDGKSLQELARSIKQSGVFQPIIVRHSEVKGYEIIAGERRFHASKLAGRKTIPAIVRTFTEAEMMQVAVLENLQREDLSPLEEAQAYEMLMTNLKLTQEQLAYRLGKSRPYIANYLRILSLPDDVKTLLKEEKLSMGQARTLLSLKDPKLMSQLAKRAVKENLTVRQLESIVNLAHGPKKPAKKPTAEKPVYLRESEDKLREKFGTSVVIHEKTGRNKQSRGKIEIEYLSADDLERILEILAISQD